MDSIVEWIAEQVMYGLDLVSGLISTNNNNVTVEIKCSQMEKELITTDRRELQEILDRAGAQKSG